jgi:hypothetical protein
MSECGMEDRVSEQSDNIDIYRAAHGLLKAYGDRAEAECGRMIERWQSRGDAQAANLWRAVLNVVREGGASKTSPDAV